MNQPDQPRSRRERKERERAAQQASQQAEAGSTFPTDPQPGQSGLASAAQPVSKDPQMRDCAPDGGETASSQGGLDIRASRPFVRPAQRNSRRSDGQGSRVGSQGSAYGSGPQTAYGSGPAYAGTAAGAASAHGSGPVHSARQDTAVEPGSAHSVAQRERAPLGFVRGTIRTFGELCITSGLILILFVVWQLWWTDIQANKDNSNLASQLTTQWKENPANKTPDDPDTPVITEMPEENEAFGIMYIPRFGDDYFRTMAEGISLDPVLNEMGVGHYPSTARPGEVGNFAIAGHRVTYGKPLNLIAEMRPGDDVIVQTAEGFYTYTMRNFEIIVPDQTEVLAPVPAYPDYKGKDRIMTLTACNPMFSARERYVVYAELTEWRPVSKGAPDAIADSKAYEEAGGQ